VFRVCVCGCIGVCFYCIVRTVLCCLAASGIIQNVDDKIMSMIKSLELLHLPKVIVIERDVNLMNKDSKGLFCKIETPEHCLYNILSYEITLRTLLLLLLLLLLQNLYSAQIQASSSQRRWRVARWGTWLAGVGKEVRFETAFERANGW